MLLKKIGAALTLFGVSAVFIYYGVSRWRMFRTYRSFPSVSALVSSTHVMVTATGEGGYSYWPKIEFQYTVEGIEYTSRRLWSLEDFGAWALFSEKRAHRFLEKMRCDPNFRVFYDPANPSFAFARNGHWAVILIPLILGFGFFSSALYAIASAIHEL